MRGAEGAPLRSFRGLPSLITSLRLSDDCRSNKEKRSSVPRLLLLAFCTSLWKLDCGCTLPRMMLQHR